MISQFGIDTKSTQSTDLMPYKKYISAVYHAKFIISDSGTAQEEPALFKTPVLVPREFTERPQSYNTFCSRKLHISSPSLKETIRYIDTAPATMNNKWLGGGLASSMVLKGLMA
jgi:UDP-N-acetylglucosamine 2-epimerase